MLFDLDTPMSAGWYEGLIVKLYVSSDNKCSFELYPIRQCEESPSVKLLDSEARELAIKRIKEYSDLLDNEHTLFIAWEEVLKPMRQAYLSKLLISSYTLMRIARRLGLTKFIKPVEWYSLFLENILRFETHREVLLDILDSR